MDIRRIKELELGDYFVISSKSIDCNTEEVKSSSSVWVRGSYDRSSKKYSCYKYDDVNHENFFKGDKKVFVDFIF